MKLDNNRYQLLLEKGSSFNTSRNIFVVREHYEKWEDLRKNHEGNYYLTSILRGVYSLNALAGGRKKNPPPLKINGAAIHYRISDEGDIILYGFELDEVDGIAPGNQSTGVYKVKFNNRISAWETSKSAETNMDLNHKWHDSHYAAVSGRFDDKEAAGKYLIEHISNAYQLNESSHRKSGNHFSLFWQKDTYNSEDHIVSLVQQALSKKSAVSWLVHGEGAGTFVRAMETLKAHPSLSRFEASDEEIIRNLIHTTSKQRVFFSNPRGRGANEENLKGLCEKVGFRYSGTRINRYDLRNEDNRKKLALTTLFTSAATGVSGSYDPLSLADILKSLEMASNANGFVQTAGIILAGGVIAIGTGLTLSGFGRSLPNTWKSSFGNQNQRWAS